jgi:hypothetical protein
LPLAARLTGFNLGGGGGEGAGSGAAALLLVALPTAAAAPDEPGSSSILITLPAFLLVRVLGMFCFFTRRIIYKTAVKSPHYFLIRIKMDYDIPTDPVELKRLHAYCQRLYYRSVPPEKKKVMQDKQRIKARLKYQTQYTLRK